MTLMKHCDGEDCQTVSMNVPVTVHGKNRRGKELILHACSAVCLDDLIDRFFPEQAQTVPPVPAVVAQTPPTATEPTPAQIHVERTGQVPVFAPRGPVAGWGQS